MIQVFFALKIIEQVCDSFCKVPVVMNSGHKRSEALPFHLSPMAPQTRMSEVLERIRVVIDAEYAKTYNHRIVSS